MLAMAFPTTAAQLCIEPSSNGLSVSTPCFQQPVELAYVGFATESAEVCNSGTTSCLVTAREQGAPDTFDWSISASAASFQDHVAPVGPGPTDLYLWLVCDFTAAGLETAEFALGGDLDVISFTPTNGFLNYGTDTDLRLAVGGCPQGPLVAGVITVEPDAPVGVDRSGWGRVKAGYR